MAWTEVRRRAEEEEARLKRWRRRISCLPEGWRGTSAAMLCAGISSLALGTSVWIANFFFLLLK